MSNWPIFGSARHETLGDTDEGVVVTAGSANALGSWSVIGTTTFEWQGFMLLGRIAASQRMMIDVGIGGAGSEQVIVDSFYIENGSTLVTNIGELIPVKVPAGASVSCRIRSSAGSSVAQINLYGFAPEFPTPFPSGFSKCEMLNPDTTNTTPAGSFVPDASAANEGAWGELVASTAKRYAALWAMFSADGDTSRTASDFAIDIGIGAAGSEIVLLENLVGIQEANRIIGSTALGPFFLDIPAGTRVAGRVQCDAAASNSTFSVALMGLVA